MAIHRHAFKETRTNPTDGREENFAECGERIWGRETGVTCPKCNAVIAKRELIAHPELSFGQPIRDKEWLGYDYRSIWPLRTDGNIVGFATLKNGWGKSWRVCRVEADGHMGTALGGRWGSRDRFRTKEQALLAVPSLVADGRLFAPQDAQAAVERAREADRRKAEADRREREEQKAKEEELRNAFESIADLPLTNMQRDALAQVYRRTFGRDFPVRLKKAC